MIRGGHIDLAILGAMRSPTGRSRDWMVQARWSRAWVGRWIWSQASSAWSCSWHTTKNGEPKILPECTLPLTGVGVVSRIITDLGVFDVSPQGLVLVETAAGVEFTDLEAKTGVPLRA